MSRLLPRLLLLAGVRALRRHPVRTALIVGSTALGVASMIGTFAVNDQVFGAFDALRRTLGAAAPLTVDGGPNGVDADLVSKLSGVPGVAAAVPVVTATVPLRDGSGALLVLGIDPKARDGWLRAAGRDPRVEVRRDLVLGLRPSVLLDRKGAERKAVSPGGTLEVRTPSGHAELVVAGLFDAGPLGELLGGLIAVALPPTVQVLAGRPTGIYDRIDLFLAGGARPEAVLPAAAAAAGPGATVSLGGLPAAGADRAFAHMVPGLMLAAFTAVLAAAFLVHNVHAITLAERRPEVGTVRALGGTRRQVLFPLLGEAVALGGTGSVLGLPLGYGVAVAAVSALRDNLPLIGLPGDPEVRLPEPGLVLLALSVGVAATVLAVLALAVPVAREPPALSMRRRTEPGPRALGVAGAVLAAAFLAALVAAAIIPLPGSDAAFSAIGALGLGFGLLGPVLARAALVPLSSLVRKSVLDRIALQNLQRHPRRVGLTMAAVGLAVALGVQSSAVIESFRGEILRWVEGSITGDLFMTSGAPRIAVGKNQPLEEGFLAEVRALPGVRSARGARGIFVPYGEDHVYLVGIDMDAFEGGEGMTWHSGSWKEAAPRLLSAEGVLVSDNFAGLHGLQAGDRIRLPGADGPYGVEVLGVVTDYSWGRGTILAERSLLARRHRTPTLDMVVLSVTAGTDPDAVRRELKERFGDRYGLLVTGGEGFREMVIGELSAVFSFAAAQQFVVLGLAFLAVLNTVTLSIMARRRELRRLAAIGATPAQLRRLAVTEGTVLSVLGAGFGLVLGVVVTRILMRDLLFAASGWRLPVTLPWPVIGGLVVGAVVVGWLAGRLGLRLAAAGAGIRDES